MTYTKRPLKKLQAEEIIKRGKARDLYRKGHHWYVTWKKRDKRLKNFIIANNFRIEI